jgi:hypothetical protein
MLAFASSSESFTFFTRQWKWKNKTVLFSKRAQEHMRKRTSVFKMNFWGWWVWNSRNSSPQTKECWSIWSKYPRWQEFMEKSTLLQIVSIKFYWLDETHVKPYVFVVGGRIRGYHRFIFLFFIGRGLKNSASLLNFWAGGCHMVCSSTYLCR